LLSETTQVSPLLNSLNILELAFIFWSFCLFRLLASKPKRKKKLRHNTQLQQVCV
jgi:hypothetical protein